jgi:hypothetical protein
MHGCHPLEGEWIAGIEGESTMLNPFDVETRLAQHRAALEQVERQGWMMQERAYGRRLGRTRDRLAHALFALAARVDPDALPAPMRTAGRSSRL